MKLVFGLIIGSHLLLLYIQSSSLILLVLSVTVIYDGQFTLFGPIFFLQFFTLTCKDI
jgi:hypothetical protein